MAETRWAILGQLTMLTKNSVIGSAASYTLTVTLANQLGPTQFGHYSYILIFGSIVSVFISFATDTTAPVLMATSKDKTRVLDIVYSTRATLFAVFLVAFAGALFWDPVLALGVLAIALASFNLGFLYEVTGDNIPYSYIFLAERLSYVGLAFLLIFLGHISVAHVFVILMICTTSSILFQVSRNWDVLRAFRMDWSGVKHALMDNYFLVLISFSTFAYGGFSRLVLEHKFGLKELGIYSAGWQIILAVTIFQAQVDRIWRMRLSQDLVARDRASLYRHVRSFLLLATGPVILLALAVYIFSPQIVHLLFGPEYALLTKIIPILCVYFVVINLDGLAMMFWIGIGHRTEYFAISIAASLLLIAGLLVLPVDYGVPAVAMLVVCTHGLSVACMLLRFYVKYISRWPSSQEQ